MGDGDTGELRCSHPLKSHPVVLQPVVKGNGQEGEAVGEGEGGEVPTGGTAPHRVSHEDNETEKVGEETERNDD